MAERPSQCPSCGDTRVRFDAQDGVAWCRACGREFEPYQQADDEVELMLADRMANALEARWRAQVERAGGGNTVALTTLVDVMLAQPTAAVLTGRHSPIEDQAKLTELLQAEDRYAMAILLLQTLARAGRVRELEQGVWRLEAA